MREDITSAELVSADKPVWFDMSGKGDVARWSWLTSDEAWLVWDPTGRGEISSASQLFGNVTFGQRWRHGYEALGSLDADQNGVIDGLELQGLALWHDKNRNGRADSGEVQPLTAWKIVALSTGHRVDLDSPEGFLISPAGVTFEDGQTRPTYDVFLEPQTKKGQI